MDCGLSSPPTSTCNGIARGAQSVADLLHAVSELGDVDELDVRRGDDRRRPRAAAAAA